MLESRRLAAYVIPYVLTASFQYPFAKDGLRFIDPMTFMGIRYLIIGAVCFVIARNFRLIMSKGMIILSVSSFLSSALWALGLQYVSAAQSAVLSYTMPLFAIPLSVLLLKENTSRVGLAGALLGFIGVVIYGAALTSSGGSVLGIALSVLNAFFWALYTVYYRKLKNQSTIRTVGSQFFVGGLLFLPFIPFTYSLNPAPEFFVDLGYVSLIGGVLSLVLWNVLVRMDRIGRITTLVFAVPATSIIIQSILTDQLPTFYSAVGVCAMFAGIYLSRLQPGKRFAVAQPRLDVSVQHD